MVIGLEISESIRPSSERPHFAATRARELVVSVKRGRDDTIMLSDCCLQTFSPSHQTVSHFTKVNLKKKLLKLSHIRAIVAWFARQSLLECVYKDHASHEVGQRMITLAKHQLATTRTDVMLSCCGGAMNAPDITIKVV